MDDRLDRLGRLIYWSVLPLRLQVNLVGVRTGGSVVQVLPLRLNLSGVTSQAEPLRFVRLSEHRGSYRTVDTAIDETGII